MHSPCFPLRAGSLARVQQPPAQPRWALCAGGDAIGSVVPAVADALALSLPPASDVKVLKIELKSQYHIALDGFFASNLTAAFGVLADTLRAQGLSGPWRHECLPVANTAGRTVAQVERGVVRVLGLRTQAVHLVGLRPDGAVWVQQRSFSKPNDPGLWDTLMGGTVAGSETVADTLTRETWEEAGLHLSALGDLTHHGHFTATRPVPDGGGAGYLVEDTHWVTATVPGGLEPINQDGEVDHFECWPPERVREAVAQGLFTPEAAWVLTQVLGH